MWHIYLLPLTRGMCQIYFDAVHKPTQSLMDLSFQKSMRNPLYLPFRAHGAVKNMVRLGG